MTDINARMRLKLLAGAAALTITGCGGGSQGSTLISSPSAGTPSPTPNPVPAPPPYMPVSGLLKNTFRQDFEVGAAIQSTQLSAVGGDAVIVADQFNSITAEYEMKPDIIAPTEGVYNFSAADALIAFAEANNLAVRGHALVWHQTTPDYFLQGTKDEIKARLEKYVTDVVTRYKGKIFAWDVVNEVITDNNNATSPYRQSNWQQAVGSAEYIDWAFQAARAADPDALLFINDYATEQSAKRGRLLQVMKDLQDRNIPLDGIGHQMHLNVQTDAADVLAAIDDVDNQFMGLAQHVTELDISVYNDPGSCWESETGCQADYGASLPATVVKTQGELYRNVMRGFAARPSVTSVTLWGVSDGQSWLNTVPTRRSNYPLLYDRNFNAKPAFRAITDPSFIL